MADKATLLEKLPPVAQESSAAKATQSGPGAGTALQADQEISISAFQAITYGSFVLTFILAGFAAVVLYRKAIGDIEQRIVRSAKTLALVIALMALHGFAATYLYTNYLREVSDSAPLSMTVLIWVILGVTTGYVSNRLIELKEKLKTSDALIDGVFYAAVFVCVTLAVAPGVGSNAALILSLLAVILCIVPFSLFFTACKRIKFNRKGSKRKPGRSVLYTLVSLPTLVPLIVILHVAELLGPDLTLFLINAVSLTLVAYISFAMLTRINHSVESVANEDARPASASATEQPSDSAAEPEMDPLVAELLAEQEAMTEEEAAPAQSHPEAPEMIPPEKPTRPKAKQETPKQTEPEPRETPPQPEAPKKPGQPKPAGEKQAKDRPLKVKPPTKPKKRL